MKDSDVPGCSCGSRACGLVWISSEDRYQCGECLNKVYAARVGMVSVEDACEVVDNAECLFSPDEQGVITDYVKVDDAIAAIRKLATHVTCERCGELVPKANPVHTCDHGLEDRWDD